MKYQINQESINLKIKLFDLTFYDLSVPIWNKTEVRFRDRLWNQLVRDLEKSLNEELFNRYTPSGHLGWIDILEEIRDLLKYEQSLLKE